jgi:hypothetical protein
MYYLECGVAQAAQHLGVPPGTVKSRPFYAVRALRGALEKQGVLAGWPRRGGEPSVACRAGRSHLGRVCGSPSHMDVMEA